jgi:hypothetical protein
LNEPTFRKERKYLAIVASSADRVWGKGVEPIVTIAKKSWSFLLLSMVFWFLPEAKAEGHGEEYEISSPLFSPLK